MISPPAVVAILGDGQLGRMLAQEGKRLGYTMWAVGSDREGPSAQVVDRHICLALDDAAAVAQAVAEADVVTFETEHVPSETLKAVMARAKILPNPEILLTLQDRLTQKLLLQRLGLPVATFCEVSSLEQLQAASSVVGLPFIFKTRRGGYDGRGQILVTDTDQLQPGAQAFMRWHELGQPPGVAEAFVAFAAEISIILARNEQGEVKVFPLAQNVHSRHVLRTTRAPAAVSPEVAKAAFNLANKLAGALNYVGVMALETFLLPDGELLINEIAPRVHNSGHYTWGGSATSQFEQHLRAILGQALGDTTTPRPVVMGNLLGDLWAAGPPPFERLIQDEAINLVLYGKAEARPGRKMGHFLVLDDDGARALVRGEKVLNLLEQWAAPPPAV